nr:MAG TPA: hypothetical protein [Caudoviricetes sp.]
MGLRPLGLFRRSGGRFPYNFVAVSSLLGARLGRY